MNRKLIVILALLIAVVGLIGIWMPEIHKWKEERAYWQERKREDAAFARDRAFMERYSVANPSNTQLQQLKLRYCADPDRHLVSPTVRVTVESFLMTECGDE